MDVSGAANALTALVQNPEAAGVLTNLLSGITSIVTALNSANAPQPQAAAPQALLQPQPLYEAVAPQPVLQQQHVFETTHFQPIAYATAPSVVLQQEPAPMGMALTDHLPDAAYSPLSIEDFVSQNGLESWVADALYLLSAEQQAQVMSNPLNLANTTNLNGVITSRIKEVAPVEQRLHMFIKINGLAEGVVDRLNTLTSDQHEKVMESTLKIQKANNPSGVAMKRITDVLRHERLGISHGPHLSNPGYKGIHRELQDLQPQVQPQPQLQLQPSLVYETKPTLANLAQPVNVLTSIVESLGGLVASGVLNNDPARPRSRSPRPRLAGAPNLAGSVLAGALPQYVAAPVAVPVAAARPSSLPADIQAFLDEYRLEWWVGEVLTRLSLFQRQHVMQELANMRGVRNPSGVVMARVRQVATTQELLTIFIDINQIDRGVADELWALQEEQQQAVMAPGIFVQNARSPSVAVRSRIRHVLAGNDAMGGARRTGGQSPDTLLSGV
mmetsp:Transcript_41194/g.113628  ORF Transcript_41194/g.113628 Transcript_41194/m.113628 type:complete len:500 (-) Transcript_41194:97-1596(-)